MKRKKSIISVCFYHFFKFFLVSISASGVCISFKILRRIKIYKVIFKFVDDRSWRTCEEGDEKWNVCQSGGARR